MKKRIAYRRRLKKRKTERKKERKEGKKEGMFKREIVGRNLP